MNPNRISTLLSRAVAVMFTASLLAAGLQAQITKPVVPNRITQTINNDSRVTLHGMVSPLANAANDRGAAPASMQVNRIHMVLKRSVSQEQALRTLIQEQNTPGSPEYHKWLTPAELGQKFGPSSQDLAKITSWLQSEGFSGVKVNPGGLTIEFNGTAAQMAHTFHADFHRYQVNGKMYDAVANNPQIPTALAPVVQGFVALNNFPLHKYTRVLGQASYNPQTRKAKPEWAYPEGSGNVSNVMSPQDFGVEYDLPNTALNNQYPAGSPQYTGAGETIAIINEANINVSLVNSYRSLFGLPPNPPHVIIVGNDPGIDGINNPDGPNGASIEAYLDVEEAGAVAPDATIDLVIAADTASEQGLILAAEHAVYSDVAPVMSVSFGNCEQNIGQSNTFYNQLWEQAAAEGITVMVSSGDSGSASCDSSGAEYATGGLAVSGLASTPYDVAVGGTDFYYSDWNKGSSTVLNQIGNYWNLTGTNTPQASIKGYIPEQAWNDSQYGDDVLSYYQSSGNTTVGAGGGGASSCIKGTVNTSTGAYSVCSGGYAKPAWQTGFGSGTTRDVPDVSLFAADGANYSYYPICSQDGDCQTPSSGSPAQITGVGGTSAAAPAFAGIMALVNEKYGRQGQADNVLYPLSVQDPTAFHDVVNGTNTVPCEISPSLTPDCISVSSPATVTTSSGTPITEGEIGTGTTAAYNAGAGYDLATGLGSVNAANLINDWGNVKFAGTSVTLTSPTKGATITHGQSMTFTGTVQYTGVTGTTPTGDVSIETSSTEPGQQAQTYFTLSNGSFNGAISYLPGGTYNVWARYAGDTKNAPSTSSPVQITVNPESSTVLYQALTYNSNGSTSSVAGTSIPYGSQVLFDATPYGSNYYTTCIQPSSPPSSCNTNLQTPATGTVTFKDGTTVLNTAVLDSEGSAEYATPALTVGQHSITANYSGDNSYNPSTGSAISVTVTKATPVILIAAPTSSGSTGQNYVLTVLVATNGVGTAPTGTLTVSGAPSGTTSSATLGSTADPTYGNTSAVANIVIPGTATAGNYNLKISYGGDSNYNSASTSYSFTIGSAANGSASSISASASPSSPSATTPITVKATVTGQSGQAAPTGTVYFVAGIINPNTSSQISEQALFQGSLKAGSGDTSTLEGQVPTSYLVQGDNYLTVYYGGDSNYAPSSTVLNLSNPMSDFSLVAEQPLVSINQSGGTNTTTDTVNLTSVNGFSGTVDLKCTAPSGLTCTLDQSSVNLTSSTTTTTGPISELHKLMLFGSGGGMALGFLFLWGIPARKRKWRNMIGMVLVFAVLSFGAFGVIGCGGGSGSSSGGNFGGGGSGGGTTTTSSSNGGTSSSNGPNVTVPVKATITGNGSVTPGSYQVVVTGTASSTSQVHTITITTVVQ